MAVPEVRLLSAWVSPFALRAKLALEVKGVKYEEIEEDFSNKSELLLQSNPIYKKVPVLIHNGKPVCESTIIVEYIDEVWPSSHKLLPEDPYERALARFWADYADKKFNPAVLGILFKGGEEQEKAKEETIESLKTIEKGHAALNPSEEHPFFGGERPGYVDIILAPFVTALRVSQSMASLDVCVDGIPRLRRWITAVEEHPVLGKCLPDLHKVVPFLTALRAKRLQP